MNKICEFIQKHINFGFQKTLWFGILTILAIIPAIMFLPVQYGYDPRKL